MSLPRSLRRLGWVAALAVACGGGTRDQPEAPQVISITVAPERAEVAPNGQQQFIATVAGASAGVEWSIVEGRSGGAVTAAGIYTAPVAAGTYHVVATVVGHSEASAAATVVVVGSAPSLVIAPAQGSVPEGGILFFTVSVDGAASTPVRWAVVEGAAGGTIDETGRYTAPRTAGTWHVTATSQTDASLTATATVTVTATPASVPATPPSVTVTPATATVQIGGAVQFAVTQQGSGAPAVTWSVAEGPSGGTVSSTGAYTAPLSPGVYHVAATSVVDPAATSTSTLTVTDPAQNLVDHGGPVLATPHVYMIWWGDPAVLAGPKAAVESFITDLEGSSYLAVAEQYLRGAKPHVSLAGHFYDSTIPAQAFGTDIMPKACAIITASGQPIDPLGVYFVVTSFPMSYQGGAGWHSYAQCNGVTYRLAWIEGDQGVLAPCPTPDFMAMSAVEIFSHELLETMTDGGPGIAWREASTVTVREIADKCPSACYTVGKGVWFVNTLWSNAEGGCVPP